MRSGPPDLTVVIPAYRAEATVRLAVDSALAQEGLRTQVIVVVDGIFDLTVERLRDYAPDQVTVVTETVNRGASRARNRGLELAQTEFVMFLDADDFVEGPFLGPLVTRMRSAEAEIGFAALQILLKQEGRRLPRFQPEWRTSLEVFRDWHAHERYVGTTGTIWRTSFLRQIGGWDPEISRNDDGELVMRAILKGARFAISSSGQGIYVHHSSDSMNQRSDNMDSLLRANRKLLAIHSPVVSREHQQQICGVHYLNIACHAYLAGRDDIGDEAWSRSRFLGVKGKGAWHHQLGFRLLGPRRLVKFDRWLQRKFRRS